MSQDRWISNKDYIQLAFGTVADVRTYDGCEHRMTWEVRPYKKFKAAAAWWPASWDGDPIRWGQCLAYRLVTSPTTTSRKDIFDPGPWTLDELERGYRVKPD